MKQAENLLLVQDKFFFFFSLILSWSGLALFKGLFECFLLDGIPIKSFIGFSKNVVRKAFKINII
jgi:hypothetical protein